MEELNSELQEKRERLQEILEKGDWSKDEAYEEGTWQDDLSWEYGMLIDDINELEEKIATPVKQQGVYLEKFKEFIVSLKENYDITMVMGILANDVAWDMTEGWDDMEIESVEEYFKHQEEFFKALQFGEKVMREEVSSLIDMSDYYSVNDMSMDYACGSVEEEFRRLVNHD